MKKLWYGDNRDLVKWGSLVQLAQEEGIDKIVQVAFFRETERPQLRRDEKEFSIPPKVWTYFRDMGSIKALSQQVGVEITVVDDRFDAKKRLEYLRLVKDVLRQSGELRKIVLLDPDTGIEPKTAKPEHVTVREISEVWKSLSPGDWLALYQHRYRDQQWQDTTRNKFADACGTRDVRTFSGPTVASDVAVFAAEKP